MIVARNADVEDRIRSRRRERAQEQPVTIPAHTDQNPVRPSRESIVEKLKIISRPRKRFPDSAHAAPLP
jgi:hypothetical protein